MNPGDAAATGRQDFLKDLDVALRRVDVVDPADDGPPAKSISALRRGRRRATDDPVRVASLVDVEGVLTWQPGLLSSRPPRRAGRRGAAPATASVLKHVRFEELEPSAITALLDRLDQDLTPHRGLRRWNGRTLVPVSGPPRQGRMLLVVHGTFSNSTNVMEALSGTKDGRAFLRTARTRYPDGIFAFDHPTLAASPLENAVDLARTFQESRAEVDVIAHSRGGVVTRWWFEMLSPEANQRRKAIFVGSPLAGTSLAAPPRWKSLLDYLTNVSAVIGSTAGAVSFAVPCLTVASGLLRILGSITGLAAKSPLADAAVALVPGLHGQSRVGNQPGLTRLRLGRSPVHARYFAVQSDFEPDPVGWKFWRLLNRPLDRLTDLAADALFDGPNDLVVDVDSMTDVTNGVRVPIERLYDWPRNSRVHHTNYFAQPQLYGKLAEWLF